MCSLVLLRVERENYRKGSWRNGLRVHVLEQGWKAGRRKIGRRARIRRQEAGRGSGVIRRKCGGRGGCWKQTV